jgi:phosphate acetyltransferase
METTNRLDTLGVRAIGLVRGGVAPLRVAVVHPCQADALAGALQAAASGLVRITIFAPQAKLRAVAEAAGLSLAEVEIVDVPHSHAAAEAAVRAARDGRYQALMKGSLHTDELMHAVLDRANGLRTDRRASHVFVIDVPGHDRLLLLTDGAITISPDLEQKADIVRNAIELAHALGIAEPRVALLSAIETVTPKLVATVDAAALCKMAERGQIVGGILDGPLAFDNAISAEAARMKNLRSPVSGRADVLVAPDLESGNLMAKQLDYLAGARSAGIVLGARVPIILTSRADSPASRVASCALALLWSHARRQAAAAGTGA